MTTENSRADALTDEQIKTVWDRECGSYTVWEEWDIPGFVRACIAASPSSQPAAAPIEASGLTGDLLDQIRGDFEEAFQLIFSAYSVPDDRYNSDHEALFVKRGKIIAAITPLQRVRAILTAPQPAPSPADERAAFERELVKRVPNAQLQLRDADDEVRPGEYEHPTHEFAWRMWQARAASANETGAEGATIPEEVIREQESLNHPATQVFFRAGLLACREYMARFVERESPAIAASIRANWWPSLGNDFGAPRKLDWNELTEGEYGEDGFRAKSADEISPTQEALPIALQFLESLKRVATIDMGLERSFATAMAAEAVAIPNSPAYCLRDLYKPADEYFIDGKPCTSGEYIAWQAGIIEAVTKAKLPDPKYYGGSAEEGDQHDVKCAYVDGWNDCRASILAAPQPAQAAMPVLTNAMRAVITNESGAYQSADDLYAALCAAARDERPAQADARVGLADARIARLRAAIEGECDGLHVDYHHAKAILAYLDDDGA